MEKSIEEIQQDYHLFIDVQTQKYFTAKNIEAYKTNEEAEHVIGKILNKWNDEIAGQHDKLDTLSPKEKKNWFNSIEIDFTSPAKICDIKSGEEKRIKEFPGLQEEAILEFYNNIFYFLPKNSFAIILASGPALQAYGLPIKRFEALVRGEKFHEVEIHLFEWVYNLSRSILAFNSENNKKKKENLLRRAIEIAVEELEPEAIPDVIEKIGLNLLEFISSRNRIS